MNDERELIAAAGDNRKRDRDREKCGSKSPHMTCRPRGDGEKAVPITPSSRFV